MGVPAAGPVKATDVRGSVSELLEVSNVWERCSVSLQGSIMNVFVCFENQASKSAEEKVN